MFRDAVRLLIFWMLLASSAEAGMSREAEYKIKAVMLYKMANFVKWPESEKQTLDICTLGGDPFGQALQDIVGARVKNRVIRVQALIDVEASEVCDVVFITRSKAKPVLAILQQLSLRPILTVSDQAEFARQGGMVNLIIVANKIRFEVNRHAAKQAGLSFYAQFLSLSILVNTPSE